MIDIAIKRCNEALSEQTREGLRTKFVILCGPNITVNLKPVFLNPTEISI